MAEQVAAHSEAVGIDLAAHGTVSDADTIRDTAVAQPLIVSAGLVSLAALLEGGRRERIAGIAGHLSARSPRPPEPGSSPRPTRWCSSASAPVPWPLRPPPSRPR